MFDLQKLKRTAPAKAETIGVRVDTETKSWLEQYCRIENIKSVSTLVAALIMEFKRKAEKK